jgi:uncharacterized Tic20 family protein
VRRLHLAWAVIPTLLAALLVWTSLREDVYIDDGRSYWETHPDGRQWVVGAVAFDLVTATVLVAAGGRRLVWIIGGVLTLVAMVVTVAAFFAISAN